MGGAADEAVEDANVGAGTTNGGADGTERAGIGGTGRPGNEPVAFTGRPGPSDPAGYPVRKRRGHRRP